MLSSLARVQHSRTLANGGATFTRDGQTFEPTFGFIVGGEPGHRYVVTLDDFTPELIAETARRNPGASLIGTWIEGGDRVWIEPVRIVGDRTRAIRIAEARNELAVWDIANSTEIGV